MPTKLSLRLDEPLVDNAKTYAVQQGRSVSQLVADYFARLHPATDASKPATEDSPITASLRGALRGRQLRGRCMLPDGRPDAL